MKVEIETKYDVGDVLFYINCHNEIEKKTIEKVAVISDRICIHVRYDFEDGGVAWEENLESYASSIDLAAQIIAQRAINMFNKKEE